MKLDFISSLINSEQKGGLYLRDKGVTNALEGAGLTVKLHYAEKRKLYFNPIQVLKSLLLDRRLLTLFRKAKIQLDKPDFVLLDNLRQFQWSLSNIDNAKVFYNAHNLEFENYFPRDEKNKAAKLRKYEIGCMKKSDGVFVCSQREKDILTSYDKELAEKVFVIPNLVDMNEYKSSSNKKVISFIGTLDYLPNQQAINYLCNEFMPEISQEIKDQFEFVIAGRNPNPEQERMCIKSGFQYRSNLSHEEMATLFADSLITLVPLSHGSGTRLKIIESIFSEALVLSTPLGCEGFSSPLITSTPLEKFSESLSKLIKSRESIDIKKEKELFSAQFDTKQWIQNNKDELLKFIQR